MKIETGQAEQHPTPLPIDASTHPGVQAPTQVASNAMVQMGPLCVDSSGVDFTADAQAAMSAGMAAELGRRQHYMADMTNEGPGQYGDLMGLPEAPAFVNPASNSYLYPWQGDEPVPAG